MKNSGVPPYKQLAEQYDRVFTFGRAWGEAARQHYLKKLLPRVETICDLAGGTGTTALELVRRGHAVTCVDLSPTMCKLARSKARQAGLKLKVVQADMRDFTLPAPVDLVICEFDAINHIPEREDLPAVLHSVSRALKPGGHFYFDANNLKSFLEVWPMTWMIEEPGVVAVIDGGYDEETGKAFSNISWFLEEGKLWRRVKERVEEVCWTEDEIRAALADAGFDAVRSTDAARFYEGSVAKRGHRTLYLARKR